MRKRYVHGSTQREEEEMRGGREGTLVQYGTRLIEVEHRTFGARQSFASSSSEQLYVYRAPPTKQSSRSVYSSSFFI